MIQPDILTHPHIPKPLHGRNPRSIFGQTWWNDARKRAYARYNDHCWACSIYKLDAWPNKYLEAHETYEIDYVAGRSYMKEITALCSACHRFIHTGFMEAMIKKGKMNVSTAVNVLQHGFNICLETGMCPSKDTIELIEKGKLEAPPNFFNEDYAQKNGFVFGQDWEVTEQAKWSDWRLIIDDTEYEPLFADIFEWKAHYEDTDK